MSVLSRKQFVLASLVLLTGGRRRLYADMAPEYRPRGQAALSDALIAAAIEGNVEGARKLLKRGANPTWERPARYQIGAFSLENGPALISATRANHAELLLRMFLDERPQRIQPHGAAMLSEILASPPWLHSWTVDLQVLTLLIECKVEINPRGTAPRMVAVARGPVDAVRTLRANAAGACQKALMARQHLLVQQRPSRRNRSMPRSSGGSIRSPSNQQEASQAAPIALNTSKRPRVERLWSRCHAAARHLSAPTDAKPTERLSDTLAARLTLYAHPTADIPLPTYAAGIAFGSSRTATIPFRGLL